VHFAHVLNLKILTMNQQINLFSGMFTTALRLVVGWTYFSAFWRRLVLENKLNPDEAGYIGEKFNHFLPHALGIKPMIEYMVTHPDVLWWSMVAFTIIEGVVGLIFMLGFLQGYPLSVFYVLRLGFCWDRVGSGQRVWTNGK
jgi:hypothetical protein